MKNPKGQTYLEREVACLEKCLGHQWSLQFLEYFPLETFEDCAVIVTELVVGVDFNILRSEYIQTFTEA